MTSHHHLHPPATTSSCCCCPHFSICCTHPPPDPLIHSAPSHFHHYPPPQPHLYSPHLNPSHEALHHQQNAYHPPPTHQKNQQEFQHQTQPAVCSLLRRIAALESSLLRRQCSGNPAYSRSLRDAAARTIQTHFRAFLVRRSRTLRLLKDLASIKSTLNSLKSSLNQNARIAPEAISRRAMNLLRKLDSIQGGDPMIRDGKRSISSDITRFMEFIDGATVKRSEISSVALKSVRYGRTGNKFRVMFGDERVLGEKLGGRVEKTQGFSMAYEDDHDDEERIEVENPRISINGKVGYRNGGFVNTPAKVKKSVSFAENGNRYRIFASTHEPISSGDTNSSDGSGSVDNERELVDNLCRRVEEIRVLPKEHEDDEEVNSEDGGSPHIPVMVEETLELI